jgi:hypothetical protein
VNCFNTSIVFFDDVSIVIYLISVLKCSEGKQVKFYSRCEIRPRVGVIHVTLCKALKPLSYNKK